MALIAAATIVVRLPLLSWPMGSDEGGLLLIASQWHPGTSLYGDYWVDRPPLLLAVFALADRLGGLLPLRLLGLALVVSSVLLTARIGRLVGGSPAAAALTAAVFLVHPLFGTLEVDGELVAVPMLLGSVSLALTAARTWSVRRRSALLVGAGGLAAAGALVKQNEIDALVFLTVGAVTFLATGRRRGWAALTLGGLGAVTTTGAVVLQAAALGTDPRALWDALVTFRLDAARLIGTSASAATTHRLHGLLLALLASGAPLLLVALARRLPHRPPRGALDVRWATLAVLAWETFSVLGGGSYWLHYLVCLVPGLVLATSAVSAAPVIAADQAPASRRAPLTPALASCLVTGAVLLAHPARNSPVITWLRDHDAPGQTGLVAFGHPDYLTAAGLTSPYPQLWSLPARVRDPRLHELERVLSGPRRPDWIVTGPTGSLGGWRLDARAAQRIFESDYHLAVDLSSRRIYLDDSATRPVHRDDTPQETP